MPCFQLKSNGTQGVGPVYFSYADFIKINSAAAVTWCACLVLARWLALKNDSAVPGVAISAFTSALTQAFF